MTYRFSAHSLKQRITLHEDLQVICDYLIRDHDFRIQQGHRGEAEQNEAVAKGYSKVKFPNSKHNTTPSEAMDLLPFIGGKFIGWDDWPQWRYFAGRVIATADTLYHAGIISHRIRSGIDWDRDNDLSDNRFKDAPHFEIVGL
jgi:peptidoglycan LD-endopeptidase CwlK